MCRFICSCKKSYREMIAQCTLYLVPVMVTSYKTRVQYHSQPVDFDTIKTQGSFLLSICGHTHFPPHPEAGEWGGKGGGGVGGGTREGWGGVGWWVKD